jgi:hypothetical protein
VIIELRACAQMRCNLLLEHSPVRKWIQRAHGAAQRVTPKEFDNFFKDSDLLVKECERSDGYEQNDGART